MSAEYYYAVNDQRLGPVDEAQLRQLMQQGIVTDESLIWRQGWADWQRLRDTPLASAAVAVPQTPPAFPGAVPVRPRGTGGQTSISELASRAKQSLSGKWGLAIGFSIVIFLAIFMASMILGMIPGVSLFTFLVTTPLTVSACIFYLNLARGTNSGFEHFGEGFQQYGRTIGTVFFFGLIIFVAALPLILAMLVVFGLAAQAGTLEEPDPTVFANYVWIILVAMVISMPILIHLSFRYSQIYFLLAERSSAGPFETLKQSATLMKGNYLRYFIMSLGLMGLSFLCILTLGIGYFFFVPFASTWMAHFYDDLQPAGTEIR